MSAKKRILFVEDNLDIRKVVSTSLVVAGYEVVSAANFPEGAEKIESEDFDLYIFDLNLPGGTGIGLCKKAVARDASKPVIFYTASMYQSFKQDALAVGAKEFIVKPDMDALERAVERYLGSATKPASAIKRVDSSRTLLRVQWYSKMVEAYQSMPDFDRAQLEQWEHANRAVADISEWPGWERFIGKKPE